MPAQPLGKIPSWRTRSRVLQYGLALFFLVVCFRLAQVQIFENGKYREMAQKQYQSKIMLPATRGAIYDRNGNIIASNSMFASFAADPQLAAEDADAIASKFSKIFGKPKRYYREKLQSDSKFVWLERQVSVDYLKKIDLKKLDGVVVRYEPKRLYHHDQVAGQLIGFTDIDNNGLAGMELYYDKQLHGVDGYVVFQRDGLGRARPTVDYPRVEPVNGHNVCLTIDMAIQSIAEEELRKGIEQNKADGGIVVMMEPQSGEVLALAQYPPMNPNKFTSYDVKDQRLRAVTDMFEPGSVFKVVTASAALEHNIVTPDRKFNAEHGKYIVTLVGGKQRTIRDTHEYDWITFQEGMELSSNIVMAKVSDLIGSENLYKMARDYGFGIATNIDVPGEVKGSLKKPVDWSGTTLNTIAYGYEVGVTPIQIAAAYSVVANNGTLVKPFIFEKEVDELGQVVSESVPLKIRKVISEKTAGTLRSFFEGVVERGTGKPAKIPNVRIAGKTGTSRKFVEGKYEMGSYTASFVGFFPADDPRVVCLVMMDNPRGANYTGGTTSAPIFRAIAERVLNTHEIFAPALIPDQVMAKTENTEKNITPVIPQQNRKIRSSEKTDGISVVRNPGGQVVPDVKGCSIRTAIGILTGEKLRPVVIGSGTVVSQNPAAGQRANEGMKVVLNCQPKSFTTSSVN